MSTPFGSYTVRLDPWQVECGGEMEALGASAPVGADDASVRTDVEFDPEAWRLPPPAERRPLRQVPPQQLPQRREAIHEGYPLEVSQQRRGQGALRAGGFNATE